MSNGFCQGECGIFCPRKTKVIPLANYANAENESKDPSAHQVFADGGALAQINPRTPDAKRKIARA